ncbi:MAG: hypothetical protein LRS43_01925 [Desulfurococcales archaeon]|nr:hypothetical protein [Desulfurococcales archaeon]
MATGRSVLRPLLLVAVALALIFPFIFPLVSETMQERREPGEGSPPELMAKAVSVFNMSLDVIARSFRPGGAELANATVYAEEASNISMELRRIVETFPRDLLEYNDLVLAALEYSKLAEAASPVYSSAALAPRVYSGLERSLESLAKCMVGEALDEWDKIRGDYEEVLEALRGSMDTLKEVNASRLLSDEHRNLTSAGTEAYGKALGALSEAGALLLLAEKYRSLLELLCNGSLSQLDPSDLSQALRELSGIDPSMAGSLAYETQKAQDTIEDAIRGALQRGGAQEGDTGMNPGSGWSVGEAAESSASGQTPGGGAGRGEPPSDD